MFNPEMIFNATSNLTVVNPNSTVPSFETSLILPLVLQYLTPTAVGIIGLGAVAAAVMSSADSSMLAASTMFAHNIYKPLIRPNATSTEITWVMRFGVIGAGILACTLALTVKSIYALFYLCGDLVYVMLFPQLACVIYFKHANIYGSFSGYVIGLFLRVMGGERIIGFDPIIKFPYYDEEYGQLFPFKTLSMVVTLVTIIVVSLLSKYLFENNKLPPAWDFLGVFTSYATHEKKELVEMKPKGNNNPSSNGTTEAARA